MLRGYELCLPSYQNIHEIYFLWPSFRIAESKILKEYENAVIQPSQKSDSLNSASLRRQYDIMRIFFSISLCSSENHLALVSQFLLFYFYVFTTSGRNCFYKVLVLSLCSEFIPGEAFLSLLSLEEPQEVPTSAPKRQWLEYPPSLET